MGKWVKSHDHGLDYLTTKNWACVSPYNDAFNLCTTTFGRSQDMLYSSASLTYTGAALTVTQTQYIIKTGHLVFSLKTTS